MSISECIRFLCKKRKRGQKIPEVQIIEVISRVYPSIGTVYCFQINLTKNFLHLLTQNVQLITQESAALFTKILANTTKYLSIVASMQLAVINAQR